MNDKLIITKEKNRLLLSLFHGKRLDVMETAPLLMDESMLGSIYLAKVKDIVSGINGAFLSVDGTQGAYLSFSDGNRMLVANRELAEKEQLRQNDEIVIQIAGEALKTKQPTASSDLALIGQYCVCSYWGHGITYSKKLSAEKKQHLNEILKQQEMEELKNHQFTIRTNAENLNNPAPLLEEMRSFAEIFHTLTATYKHRTCYTCFYHQEPEIVSQIKNISLSAYEEIVTGEKDVYELLKRTFHDKQIRFYQDDLLPLSKLYSISTHLQEALSRKVWLPCGGYLIIEPTEAMVVIDVNSGKAQSKGKKNRDYYLKINLEAAKEVARQLRIRNYSGMIMVDFINMEADSDNQELLKSLDRCLKEDHIRTRLVDMTALGIVEITRKKVNRPLADFFPVSFPDDNRGKIKT